MYLEDKNENYDGFIIWMQKRHEKLFGFLYQRYLKSDMFPYTRKLSGVKEEKE